MEVWKPVKGFEEYSVSNYGRVYSIKSGKIMQQKTTRKGYKEIKLFKDHERHYFRVHRLVATAFVDNPDNLPFINHIDEDKSNNMASNLEWCTTLYNNNYGSRTDKAVRARSKPVQAVKNGEVALEFNSVNDAARNGFQASCISLCCNGRMQHHKGYEWRFKEE